MDACIYKETLLQLCQPLIRVAYGESELSLRASQKFITGTYSKLMLNTGALMLSMIGEHGKNVHGNLS